MQASPVIALNRAAAVAMAEGCEAGLRLVEELEQRGELKGYYLLAAARADMQRRLERWEEAGCAYRTALQQAPQEADRRFLNRRLAEVEEKLGREALCPPHK
jgi:RNA polymerase sigma-70 factor (ECF subfamily)